MHIVECIGVHTHVGRQRVCVGNTDTRRQATQTELYTHTHTHELGIRDKKMKRKNMLCIARYF